jgi:predicted Zn finger-like uncharacterized protein
MKISCQTCQAKYTIADEKVAGKVVKIKCKKCGSAIVVNGNDPLAAAAEGPAAHAALGGGDEDDESTRVFSGEPGGSMAGADEWTVNVSDDDQRTMSTAQLAAEIARGAVSRDAYVWKDGMADWLPVSDVPELASMLPAARVSAPAPVSAPAGGGLGLGGTMMMDESPVMSPLAAAPAPAAARRAASRPAVDLFGSGGASAEHAHPSAPPPAGSADRRMGERNENSVLFSLSALTATENAAKAQKKSEDAVIDLGPSRPAKPGGRAGIDDIMNLGGGGFGAPALAPPPLLAPVVEPPPPPAPMHVAPMGGPGMGMGGPAMAASPAMMASMAPPQKKGGAAGLVIGIVAGLAVVGGIAFFALRGGGEPSANDATSEAASAVVAATAPSAEPSAAPSAEPSAAPSAEASAEPSASAAPADTGVVAAADKPTERERPTSNSGSSGSTAKTEAKSSTKEPEKPAAPAPTATAAAAAPASGNGEFNRGAASAALGGAAGAAKSCKKPDGPTGNGRVKVVFAPSGRVTSATVEGAFAGTSVGGCVAGVFRGAHIPPFDGSPVAVSKSFNIN